MTIENLAIIFIFTSLLTLISTSWLITILTKYNIIDVPGDRRNHRDPTPRGGGLSIAIIFSLSLIFYDQYLGLNLHQYYPILLPFILIASISFLDDIKNISAIFRLIIHLFCAILAYILILYPNQLFDELPKIMDSIICVLGLTFFLNIYNFLDGVDGITTVESIHLSTVTLLLCYFQYDIILHVNFIIFTSTIICAYSWSFLIFNWNPAKIFLGDVGTICLGFLIGLCLLIMASSSLKLLLSCLIASLYYLSDGGITILIRLVNKEKIWQPHLKHFFQKAIKKGMSPKILVKQIWRCNLLLMCFALSALYCPIISGIAACSTVFITLRRFS